MIKKLGVLILLCVSVLVGCSSSKEKLPSDVVTSVDSSERDEDGNLTLVSLYNFADKLKDRNFSLSWNYNGSVKSGDILIKESTNGEVSVDLYKKLQYVRGTINRTHENVTLDYYIDDDKFFFKDVNTIDELPISFSELGINESICDLLKDTQMKKITSTEYSCTYNLCNLFNDFYKYVFGNEFIKNKNINVDVVVKLDDLGVESVVFKTSRNTTDITNIGELEVCYSFNSPYGYNIPDNYHQLGYPITEEFIYPPDYEYKNGYVYAKDSVVKTAYADYISNRSCMVDTTKLKEYSIYIADDGNKLKYNDIIYSYTNGSNSYKFEPIFIQARKGKNKDKAKELLELFNKCCPDYMKFKLKDNEEIRYFTVTYTTPVGSDKTYYEPDFTWYAGVGEHDAIFCGDVTGVMPDDSFGLESGCQVTKYYIYAIDKNAKNEWVCTMLQDSVNSDDYGNVYWR